MKLKKFRTQSFRSIEDSGWVGLDDVTALVGINESGKSNLLLSLWKLNPAREGAIDPIADYPRDRYNEIRAMEIKPVFITARFSIDKELAEAIAAKTKLDANEFDEVEISRRLSVSGTFLWSFPNCKVPRTLDSNEFKKIVNAGRQELERIKPFQAEGDLKVRMLDALTKAVESLSDGHVGETDLVMANNHLTIDRSTQAKSSKVGPIFDDVIEQAQKLLSRINRPEPNKIDGVWED